MKPDFLQRVLEEATPHNETQGYRIEYDTESFCLTAKYTPYSNDFFKCEAYDLDDKEVTLTDDQMTIVYEFVKDIYDTEKSKNEELQNQF